jgi:hypothetical protein
LVFLAIVFGVAPQTLFQYVTPSVNQQVETLANWTRDVHDGARKMMVAEGQVAPDSQGPAIGLDDLADSESR